MYSSYKTLKNSVPKIIYSRIVMKTLLKRLFLHNENMSIP